ncbi:MAG: type II toxin-antitoxin system ParD family antitoxin [Acidobacteria bacterium]|nr:type II toxin-antitoxin system ParD family antitoxin [Acidobacteriota bacterium]
MTINLKLEDEQLIQKPLQSGEFSSAEEVIHHALKSLDDKEDWLQESREAINEKIERGFAQFERGEGLTPEESLTRLEAKKVAWRAEQRRG